MEEIWVLASSDGYEGCGEPGDVDYSSTDRLFFASELEALEWLKGRGDDHVAINVVAFKLTRHVAP